MLIFGCLWFFQNYEKNNIKRENWADSDGSNDGWKEVEMGTIIIFKLYIRSKMLFYVDFIYFREKIDRSKNN